MNIERRLAVLEQSKPVPMVRAYLICTREDESQARKRLGLGDNQPATFIQLVPLEPKCQH